MVQRVGFSLHTLEKFFHRVFHSTLEIEILMEIVYVTLKYKDVLFIIRIYIVNVNVACHSKVSQYIFFIFNVFQL